MTRKLINNGLLERLNTSRRKAWEDYGAETINGPAVQEKWTPHQGWITGFNDGFVEGLYSQSQPTPTTDELIQQLEAKADLVHDGHFTILAFTTNYRVGFGTPITRDDYEFVPSFTTLREALEYAVKVEPIFGEA